MTVSLPYVPGERGSLSLGALPEDANGDDYLRLPLGNTSERNTWHVGIDIISLAGNVSLSFPLTDVYADFELSTGLIFPKNVTEAIMKALNAKLEDWFYMPIINCSKWDTLPDLVLEFSGHEIVLPKEDYAVHGYLGPDEICAIDIEWSLYDDNSVTLGVQFMRKFHMVFDMDKHELGRKFSH